MIGGVIVEEIIMDKLITPPKQATSLTWGPPPDPCKQAVSGRSRGEAQGACFPPPPRFQAKSNLSGEENKCFYTALFLSQSLDELPPPPTPPKVASEARQTDTSRSGTAAKGGFFHPTHPSLLHPFLGGPCGWILTIFPK